MMKIRLIPAAIASLGLAPLAAFAQDPSTPAAVELDQLVVVGQKQADLPLSALSSTTLSGDELAHRRQGGLGETLAGLPGVHLDNFGGGASRPVIRGQTLPRIEILSDGASLFDASSVSPDHAIATDPLLLEAIEVLRGPAAVRYGGNAVNGAINLIDGKVPKTLPDGGYKGATEVRLGTGDDERTVVGRFTARLGPFAIHAEGSRHIAKDYYVPDEYGSDSLKDSFSEGSSAAFGASLVTAKGYIGAAYTRQENEYGLPGHTHANGACHTHYYFDHLDLHCKPHGGIVDPITTPDTHTAYIKLRSDRIDVRGDYDNVLPGISHLRLRGSHTDYRHNEIDGPTLFSRYTNEVSDGRVELTHEPVLGFVGTFGIQYTDGTFTGLNINDLAVPLPQEDFGLDGVPDYLTKSYGMFLSERRSFGPFELEIAARKDWRKIHATPPPFYITLPEDNWASEYYGPNWREVLEGLAIDGFFRQHPPTRHQPFSGSISGTWNFASGYDISLALGHTERAPSVRELYANGNNMATNSYELGLTQSPGDWLWPDFPVSFPPSAPDLMEETDSINLTFRKTSGATQFEVGLFRQSVDNYIFARLIDRDSETGVPHNWLLYVAADATFTGIDGQISHELTQASRFTVFGDYVRTDLRNEDDNLPRIPPGRLGVRYDWTGGPLSADAEYYRTASQDRIASYETKTAGYDMLNATVSYRLDLAGRQRAEIYVRANNLFNELAYAHTSFVKDQSPLRGRSMVFGIRYSF
jgi:iron complex outermembrane recepter protein